MQEDVSDGLFANCLSKCLLVIFYLIRRGFLFTWVSGMYIWPECFANVKSKTIDFLSYVYRSKDIHSLSSKIFDGNALMGKCTPAIFSVIMDYNLYLLHVMFRTGEGIFANMYTLGKRRMGCVQDQTYRKTIKMGV